MKKLPAAVTLVVALLAAPSVAGAQPNDTPGAFGHHVAACAREHGFDGTHNPGMHRGRAGWNGADSC